MRFTTFLAYIRKHIGNYCSDGYWEWTYNEIWMFKHPVKYLAEHLPYLAMNAISTERSTHE